MHRGFKGLAAALVLAAGSTSVRADVVTDWNEQWLDTIRAVGGGPCPLARNQAIVFVSMFEAINSINRKAEPYLGYVDVPGPASERAAGAAAAHRALVTLYPARAAIYDAQLAEHLAAVHNVRQRDNGVAVGVAAADAILAARSTDRTDSLPTYVYEDVPGAYRPTPPDFTTPPHAPGFGTTEPWCMQSGDEFRPRGPFGFSRIAQVLRSRKYADQVNEVKSFGARNSTTRTAEQTEIAWFWANDRDGTYKPPGQLGQITTVVAAQQGLSLSEHARLMALVGLALGDAGLVAWDQKYSTDVDLWRPVSAIRNADIDNNPRTTKKGNWLPLLEFSPPFPAYTSGHATFGAAHAAIMRNFFGTDNITFTASTDEPIVQNVQRTFTSFSQAARENGLSRVYLGVHFRCDADQAYASGTLLGNSIYRNFLRPISCPADLNGDNRVNAADSELYVTAYFAGDPVADFDGNGVVNEADYLVFADLYFDGCTPQ
ncbi:MAG: phosphatase PAP2 family protein [Phycisphaerales bacterium]|nr:phosphatase PAP2 family protein [Phycisphaerales bacterium]